MDPKQINEWLNVVIKIALIVGTIGSALVILRYGQVVDIKAEHYLVIGFFVLCASALLVIYAASATLAPLVLWPVGNILAKAKKNTDLEVREIHLFGATRYQIIGDNELALGIRRKAIASAFWPLALNPIMLVVLFIASREWEITQGIVISAFVMAMAATGIVAFRLNNKDCSSSEKIQIMSLEAVSFLLRVLGSSYLVLLLSAGLVVAVFGRLDTANAWFGSIVFVAATVLPLFLGALAAGLKVALPGDEGWRDIFAVTAVLALFISGFFGAEVFDQVAIGLGMLGEQ